jgi:aryl-phospho-beta-D-glucosidase BglC (GH1 family)
MLRVSHRKIWDARGRETRLRGVNLGNWLLIEGYMLAGPNEPEHRIRRAVGPGARDFFRRYQDVYITAADLRRIKRWGFNVVRVPFNHRLLSPGHGLYAQNGWEKLAWVLRAAEKAGLYVILDMHAAPGAQNADWHSDSPGRAGLWESPRFQKDTVTLWAEIAGRFKNAPALAGFDILNEPITDKKPILNKLYRESIAAVRAAGSNHLVFLEGTQWSTDFSPLDDLDDPGIVYSPHFYKPYQYTFNVELDLTYPGRVDGKMWNKETLRAEMAVLDRWAARRGAPVLIGEFGVNGRCPCCRAEARWVRDVAALFDGFGFHWTYWAYKVLSGHMHPSGLMRFPQNPPWLRREGVTVGWENFGRLGRRGRDAVLRSMDTRHFVADTAVLAALRRP